MQIGSKKVDLTIEALRGFAALVVVFHHLSWDFTLDPGFSTRAVVNYMPPGHLFVLVFFMLSGYVIGLTNPQNTVGFDTKDYLKKRLLRIYPIYIIAILISIIPGEKNITSLAAAVLFLQNAVTPNLTTNPPLWSLNHEILYYLLFIPVIRFRLNLLWVAGLSLLIGLSPLFSNAPAQLSAYGVGFFFWLTGLWLAWKTQKSDEAISFNRLVSMLSLLLCVHVFNVIGTFIVKLDLHLPKGIYMQNIVNVHDLVEFPVCFATMLLFTGRSIKWKPVWLALAYLIPAVNIGYLLLKQNIFEIDYLLAPFCFFVLSLVLLAIPKLNLDLKRLSYTGSISYALYVVHMPILFLFKKVSFFSGSAFSFSVRFCLFMGFVTLLSYYLEKIFQPFIKRFFSKKPLLGKESLDRTLPANMGPESTSLFANEFHRMAEPVGVVKRNFVFVDSLKAFTPFGIVPDSTVYPWRFLGQLKWSWTEIMRNKFGRKVITKPIVYIGDEFSFGYFHFSIDSLQKLWLAKKQFGSDFTLFLNYTHLTEYHKKLLEPFDIKQIVCNERSENLYLGTVYFPEHPCKPVTSSNCRPHLILDIRDQIINHYKPQENIEFTKIYVSRKKARNRHIVNEEEVEQILTDNGFKVVCLEDYTFEKQVEICFSAQAMVSLHGAGLTNMMYMQPGGKVLEFRQKGDTHNNCYYTLASDCQLPYYFLECETSSSGNEVHNADFFVNLEKLKELLTPFSN